jgi:hypothetical protein
MKEWKTLNMSRLVTSLGLFFTIISCDLGFSQFNESGKVLSGITDSGLSYVNVLVIGKNIGTVTDESGNFILSSANITDNDSLRFSAIGFQARTLLVRSFRKDTLKNIYLEPKIYDLREVNVTYKKHKNRVIRLGSAVSSKYLKSGFADNDLGSELGIKLNVKKPVKLQNINLNVAVCTFDSVTYRLNIYETFNQINYRNILTEPIYLSFTGKDIGETITFDLSRYAIVIQGDVLISLELYKDLGEGKLLFNTEYFTGSTYHRKTGDGKWVGSPGVIGMFINSYEVK